MGFQDRRYDDADDSDRSGFGGRFARAMRRIFVEGDDFFSWAVPLFRFRGIDVRIHILYIVFIAAELIWPLQRSAIGYAFAAFSVAVLFLLVLLHEFGHCFAARWVGGEADRIVMWPLGGLAFVKPPHNWKYDLITVLGGPAVNLALIPVLGGALLLAGAGWGAVIYNPFDVRAVWSREWFAYDAAYWKYFLWSAYHANLGLFGFNMLLVMYPMDAGRILQDLLWRKVGYRRSLLISANFGLVMAVIVGTIGFFAASQSKTLLGIALFCGIVCYNERRRAAMLDEASYELGSPRDFGYGPRAPVAGPADPGFRAAAKKQERERSEQAEVDRILAKIAATGMGSLSRSERRTLEQATRRRRGDRDTAARG